MTDQYSVVEKGFRDYVKAQMTTYFPLVTQDVQVTKSDATVLTRGYDYYLVTYPGAFPTIDREAGVRIIETNWEILVEIFSRFPKSEQDAWDRFIPFRSDLFNTINATEAGRNLNGTNGIRGCLISAEERPYYVPVNADDPDSPAAFISQVCVLNARQVIVKT